MKRYKKSRRKYTKKRYSKKRYSKKRYSKKRYSKKRKYRKRRQRGGENTCRRYGDENLPKKYNIEYTTVGRGVPGADKDGYGKKKPHGLAILERMDAKERCVSGVNADLGCKWNPCYRDNEKKPGLCTNRYTWNRMNDTKPIACETNPQCCLNPQDKWESNIDSSSSTMKMGGLNSNDVWT